MSVCTRGKHFKLQIALWVCIDYGVVTELPPGSEGKLAIHKSGGDSLGQREASCSEVGIYFHKARSALDATAAFRPACFTA
jgi:hypothetical protein